MSRRFASLWPAAWWAGAALAYLILAWLLAPQLLTGPYGGNDTPYALGYAGWIARAFPLMPFWFPYQVGGVSPSAAYAIMPLYAVAALDWAGLDPVVAGRLLAFGAMAFGGVGAAALARALGLGRGAAFATGVFWLLPSGQWNLLVHVGIYSNAIATALAPWCAAGLVAYGRYPRTRLDRTGALLLGAAVLATAAAFVAHPTTSAVPILFAVITAIGFGARAFARTLTVGIVTSAVVIGAAYAFYEYGKIASLEAAKDLLPADLVDTFIPTAVLIGLADRVPDRPVLDGLSASPFLLVLGTVGALVGLARPALRLFVIGTIAAALFMFVLDFEILVTRALAPLSPALSYRGWLIVLLLALPVLAALALEAAVLRWTAVGMRVAVVAVAVLALVVLEGAGYGAHAPGDPPFVREHLVALAAGQAQLPPLEVSSELLYRLADTKALSRRLAERGGRGDLAPDASDIVGLTMLDDSRVLMLYTNYLSLFYRAWSDYRTAMYHPNQMGVLDADVSEMAHWFGINRVALTGQNDTERYRADGWTIARDGRFVFADPPFRSGLGAWRERGVILHVGRPNQFTWRNTYRFATAGALPFATGWLVQGPACIDDVPPELLGRIDGLILEDQCERDPAVAARTLQAFVERGGRLLVETGWEGSPYFRGDPAPSFLPTTATSWGPIGDHPALRLGGGVASIADVSTFGDFRYGSATWDVSSSALQAIRPWAHPVLVAGDRVLVAAGELGQGRVVWSGLNLVQHAWQKGSVGERGFARDLFAWLLAGASTAPREIDPDQLGEDSARLTVSGGGWLLWRESPAYAEVSPPVGVLSRAGPGMLLAHVDAGTYSIRQGPSAGMRATTIAGAFASSLVIVWLAVALRSGGAADPAEAFGWIGRAIRRRLRGVTLRDEEE
ncbi:MAG TPA: hypothetical protein VGQ86_01390 [Candidatus Limnocylindria bacterium]|nr:hypothetical protein [Candidatus Limnocylindria bacterium]